MRDIMRIQRILVLLTELWLHFPDQRLGQLLINYGLFPDSIRGFMLEDDLVEESLSKTLEKIRGKNA